MKTSSYVLQQVVRHLAVCLFNDVTSTKEDE